MSREQYVNQLLVQRSVGYLLAGGASSRTFNTIMSTLSKRCHQVELLHRNALISLVSSAEWFLSQLLHKFFELHPQSSGIKDCKLTLYELQTIGSIEEARDYLLDERIEKVLRGSFSDWVDFLKSDLKLSMSYLDNIKDQIIETCQRRNLLIHNGGIVNGIYLNKVPKSARPDCEVGMPISISRSYLDTCIARFERCFILISLELWKKLDASSEERAILINNITYQQLLSERWDVAESISYFLMKDCQVPEIYRLTGQVNYWQTLKWQDRFEEIRSNVENTDFSAKEERFALAQAALLDDEDRFFTLLPRIVECNKISLEEIREWPLFRRMRDTSIYQEKYGSSCSYSIHTIE